MRHRLTKEGARRLLEETVDVLRDPRRMIRLNDDDTYTIPGRDGEAVRLAVDEYTEGDYRVVATPSDLVELWFAPT